MLFPVRWQKDESRRCRVFVPLTPDHPAYTLKCLYCDYELGGGFAGSVTPEPVQIIAVDLIEPDDEERAKLARGSWCTVGGALLHERCANQMDDEQLETFVAELAYVPAPIEEASTNGHHG